ncbi:MAG: AAA domain-containing protein, partial [Streptosporangiaceae bacterium]
PRPPAPPPPKPRSHPGCGAFSRHHTGIANASFVGIFSARQHPEGVSGQWNQFEADSVAALVWWYSIRLADGLDGRTDRGGQPIPSATALVRPEQMWKSVVGVVTPHRAQRARVIDRLAGLFATPGADPAISAWIAGAVDTVERFQGQERDIIIASYAVGDPDTVAEEAEFLHDLNRFNVLATRAKAKLIVIASRELVGHISGDLQVIRSSELLKDFVDTFCASSRPATLDWIDINWSRQVEVELRWH